MAGARHRGIVTCLFLGVAVAAALPAAAFELFGIHLWGEREPDDAVEVIDPLPYTVSWRVAGGDSGLSAGSRPPPRSGPTARPRPRAAPG